MGLFYDIVMKQGEYEVLMNILTKNTRENKASSKTDK